MSDIDDLLNYDDNELGDVDLEANEDELLLSDEEITPTSKSSTTWESRRSPVSSDEKNIEIHTVEEQVDSSTNTIVAPETEVTTTDDQSEATTIIDCQSHSSEVSVQKNGEVSSTIKDILETTPNKSSQSQTSESVQESNTDFTSDYPSSETGTAGGTDDVIDLDYSYTDGDIEDSDDPGERRNPKTTTEREALVSDSDEFRFRNDRSMRGFPRRMRGAPMGRGMSGRFPRGPPGFPHYRQPLPNENFNPQTPQIIPDFQFRGVVPDQSHGPPLIPPGGAPPPGGSYRHPFPPFDHKPMPMFGPPGEGQQFRGQNPRGIEFGPRGNRVQFRPFNPNGVRPSFRPNMPRMPPRMEIMRPPYISQASSSSSSFPAPPRPYSGPQNHMAMQQAQQQSKLPRKVLINPNFKGGVEAATNQLMMDTLQHPQFINSISNHVTHLHSDEELLRQQEEFINKNRMHIEKRRHERSPERERDRERDYSSPPPRRERRASSRDRGTMVYRSGYRGRRGDSREIDDRRGDWRRRRRSTSPERNKLDEDKRSEKVEVVEDEETRVYRIEIEKQKAMREKILRDKEMRRRKAAEDKAKTEQTLVSEKKSQEPPAATTSAVQKLTPLVVTESKIISLKRKAAEPSSNPPQIKTANPSALRSDEKLPDYVEDEESTVSLSPQRTHTPPQPPTSSSTAPVQRRLVLKPSLEVQKVGLTFAADSTEPASTNKPKGIFDRLEKKISVNEAAKRKIQRIVMNVE
ncbi:uncharacterized protein DMENIID0001_147900 [Sergentomyia squamirostris]